MKNVFRKVANAVNKELNLKAHKLTTQGVADIVTGISFTASHPVHQAVKRIFKNYATPRTPPTSKNLRRRTNPR